MKIAGSAAALWVALVPLTASGTLADELVIEAEAPRVREPDNGSFARAHFDPWASGRECVIRFSGAGRCTYALDIPHDGRWHLWLRYAARSQVTLQAGPAGAQLASHELPSTGALEGREAWSWARLLSADLGAGELDFILAAAPLRPDCLVLTDSAGIPDHAAPTATAVHSPETLALIARTLAPDRPAWLDEVRGLEPPSWYERCRSSLHTRLSPRWRERDIFRNAAQAFRDLGARHFVRHFRTLGEGAWWPSAVGPVEDWAREEDVAEQIIARAHAAGLRIVAYYRHSEDVGVAREHPDWVARDDSGRGYTRNSRPLLCLNSPYVEHIETRLLELVERGADGFYFDEVHMPRTGCWCGACRSAFSEATGLNHPETIDPRDPLYRKLLEFNNFTIEHAFLRWRRAISARREDAVLVIGNHRAPDLLDPHTSGRLLRLADGVKTEFEKGVSARSEALLERTGFVAPPRDVRLALGWSWSRDGAEGRPPHVWIPRLESAAAALAATAGVIAHGGIANLDHPEATIPDARTFSAALELGARAGPFLAGLRPTRCIALHHSERARARLAPNDAAVWRALVGPINGAFEVSLRARLPVGLLSDNLLAEGALDHYSFLFLPSPGDLSLIMREEVARFARRGGRVLTPQPGWDWCDSTTRSATSAAFLQALGPDPGGQPLAVRGGPRELHVVAYGEGARRVLALANDFAWVDTVRARHTGTAPAPVSGVRVIAPAGARAREVLRDVRLVPESDGERVVFELPPFSNLALVEVELR